MALSTTISGITSSQSMMDVIADNIANINTAGFKASKVSFETIFSRTISAGGVPTDSSGGINPKQIGLGVKLSEISKNFGRGSIQTTGRNTDLNIQGEGFFTMVDPAGTMFLSRAGNFSVDSEGNLVNPQGYRVGGTSYTTSAAGSTTTVNLPPSLVLTETNIISSMGTDVNTGDFTIAVNGGAANTISVTETDTIQDIINKINSNLSGSTAALNSNNELVISGTDTVVLADTTSNFSSLAGLNTSFVSGTLPVDPVDGDFTIAVNGGAPQTITIGAADTNTDVAAAIQALLSPGGTATYDALTSKITITGPDNLAFADTSTTFVADSNFAQGAYTSAAFTDDPKVEIAEGDMTSALNYKVTSYSISSDGALEVTYSNGARLTVTGEPIRTLKYLTAGSQEITGSDITVLNNSVTPAQLQLQLAQVINPKGLESIGGNLFALSSVAGTPSFAIGRAGGLGAIDSGALEASNVDLPSEFADMIFAQKAVEANSRAFAVQNQMMDVIVNLGR